MKNTYSLLSKKIYLPRFKSGDVLFIYKNNIVGNIITSVESLTPRFKLLENMYKKNNNSHPKKFSHVAISQTDAIFLEAGIDTGTIQTDIQTLLSSPDISYWEVYRYTDEIKNNKQFFDSLSKNLGVLYNTDFLFTTERNSFYCSQVVSKSLQDEQMLNQTDINPGPSSLYLEIKNSPDTWHNVTIEYKNLLESKVFEVDKRRALDLAKKIILLTSQNSARENKNIALKALINRDTKLINNLQDVSSTNRLAPAVGPTSYFANIFLNYKKEANKKQGKLPSHIETLNLKFEKLTSLYLNMQEHINYKTNEEKNLLTFFKELTPDERTCLSDVVNRANQPYLHSLEEIDKMQNELLNTITGYLNEHHNS